MRKFCRFLSIFVLFSLLLTSACSKNNSFYFEILTNQIKVNLNQEICLTDLNCNTNLPDYELVDFYCENSLIAVVENNKVKAINTGSTNVKVTVKYDGNYYQSKFLLIVEGDNSSQTSLSVTFEVFNINENVSLVSFSVLKNEIAYFNYSVVVTEKLNCQILSKTKVASFYEIEFVNGSEFEVTFVDNLNTSNTFTISSLEFF